MVSCNYGSPDPDKPTEDLSPNHEIIIATESDTDEEDNLYNDYQPLPTHDLPDFDDDNTSNSDRDDAVAIAEPPLSPITRIEETLVREVWTGPYPKDVDIIMDSEKVDEVKQAMVNFTLPPSSIPEWANNIPEEYWKQQLISRLQNLPKN